MLPFRMADPQSHKFVPAGATRPPTRQQIGSPSRFPPPLCGRFSDHFLLLFRFFCDFVKVELPSRPELDFEGPGLLKMILFLFWPLTHFFNFF